MTELSDSRDELPTCTEVSCSTSCIPNLQPVYRTTVGQAYHAEAEDLLSTLPAGSVDLVLTSPPFALTTKKKYGNVGPSHYVAWFEPYAAEFYRLLKDGGSLVIHMGGGWTKGSPVRSLYQYKLLLSLCDRGSERGSFHLAQEFFWFNPAKLPSPAEWVTIRRIRCKDAVDQVWWLSKTPTPKADNRKVLKPYTESMRKLLREGYNAGPRPSGHVISEVYDRDNGGAIPPNLLVFSNTESNSSYLRACRAVGLRPHPARYPGPLARFFIEFLTEQGDLVLDPFAGSNTTGAEAEASQRRWIAIERRWDYVESSKLRFADPPSA